MRLLEFIAVLIIGTAAAIASPFVIITITIWFGFNILRGEGNGNDRY